jgi:hypothetical protein
VGGEIYEYHLGVFSKLLRGWTSTGPIKPGTEARIVSRSKGWDERLDALCDPLSYFEGSPEVQSMDARRLKGGAFIYRPFLRGDGSVHYSVFARIEARSESGEGLPGRRYTHCAALIVEDLWEPELMTWAATMLFDPAKRDEEGEGGFAFGEPIPENHKTRFERRLPRLFREDLAGFRGAGDLAQWPLGKRTEKGTILHAALPPIETQSHPQVALARRLAAMLRAEDLAIHGRWLSFAFGIATNVDATGPGFAIRLDDRKPSDPPGSVRVLFSDSDPPVLTETGLTIKASDQVRSDGLYGVNWQRLPARSNAPAHVLNGPKGPLFGPAQLWPEQDGREAPAAWLRGETELSVPSVAEMYDDEEVPHDDDAWAREIVKPAPHGTEAGVTGATRQGLHGRAEEPEVPQDDGDPVTRDIRRALSDAPAPLPRPRAIAEEAGRALPPTVPPAAPPPSRAPTQAAGFAEQSDRPAAPPFRGSALAPVTIDWPPIPDAKHRWVLDESLVPRLHKRLDIFVTLLGMLDTTDFREFGRFDGLTRADKITADLADVTSLFVEAFEELVLMICIYAATGNPMRLFEPLRALLAHDAQPGIGLRARAEGSLNAIILLTIMNDGIGLEKIHLYISRQGRIARDIVAIGGQSGTARLVAPRPQDLEDLLNALAPDPGETTYWDAGGHDVHDEVNRVVDEIVNGGRLKLAPVFE